MTTKAPAKDPWISIRATTPARIGLGRVGDAPSLGSVLDFQLAHARARDAVYAKLDAEAIADGLSDQAPFQVASRVTNRAEYLKRPDLGRRLASADATRLKPGDWDAVFVIADGLSATGVNAHSVAILREVLPHLQHWKIAPPVIARNARVALGDDIGEALCSRLVVVLIGERPGLSAADSLGIYITWQPRVGRQDSERNCISNIHPPSGMSYSEAAARLAWLMNEARSRGLTGIGLQDDGEFLALE